jgi:hypothetical protein
MRFFKGKKEPKQDAYYLKEPFVYLLNPNLLKQEITLLETFPVNKILPDFVETMKEETEFVDFKLLGTATANAVRIHKTKIDIVIKHQLRIDIKEEKRKAEQEFSTKKDLPYWYNRPRLVLASNLQKWTFYEELLITFEELEQALDERTKKQKLKPKVKSEEEKPKKRRRKKLTADSLSHFDYLMNFDLTDVDQLVSSIWNIIYNLSTLINVSITPGSDPEDHEILFDLLFVERLRVLSEEEKDISQERIQLEKVRTLMSLLYLIQEGKIEAWQDEDTLEIGIKLLKLPD